MAITIKFLSLLPMESIDQFCRPAAAVPPAKRKNLTHGVRGRLVFTDDGAAIPLRHMVSTQLSFTYYLTRTRHGLITRNEESDIESGVIERLKARRGDFSALAYDIDSIRARINVSRQRPKGRHDRMSRPTSARRPAKALPAQNPKPQK